MNYIKNKPIYIQIAHDIILKILNKEIPLASLMPSVRELSVQYSVTPKTIQAVTTYLSDHNIITKKAGVGSVITNKEETIHNLHHKHGVDNTKEYITYMKTLMYTNNEIQQYINQEMKEES